MIQNQFSNVSLNFDVHSTLIDEAGRVYYMKNGDLTDFNNSEQAYYAQNINSNALCVDIPYNLEVMGSIPMSDNRFILFLGKEKHSAIYLFHEKECVLKEVISHSCLNFKNKVYGKSQGEVIYFVEKDQYPRKLDLNNIPLIKTSSCSDCDFSHLNQLDCDLLRIFPIEKIPTPTFEVVSGNLPAGIYQIAIKSKTSDYFIYSEIFNLHSTNNKRERFGINISFDCIEWEGEYEIALITHREDRGTVAQKIGKYPTYNKRVTIIDLDSPFYEVISNEVLFETNSIYTSAEHIESNGQTLVLGNLTERNLLNYQNQANQITSLVNVLKVPSERAHLYPTFLSDEVYKFTIQWVYEDGQTTNWFHIPSNVEPQPSYFNVVTGNDVWTDTCNTSQNLHWQVYNTAELLTVVEENDNGINDVSIVSNAACKKFTIDTESPYWEVTVTYTNCQGVEVTITDLAKNISICTQDINTVTIVAQPFIKESILMGEIGKCSGTVTGNCTKFTITQFNAPVGLNKGIVDYDFCIVTGTTENCVNHTVYTGDITNYEFCACVTNKDDLVIDIQPTPFTWIDKGSCDSGYNAGIKDRTECDYQVVATSTFAYWESAIPYPNTTAFNNVPFVTNCLTGIKYHKFPDRTATLTGKQFPHIHSNTANINSKEYVYILAPSFSNIQPPVDCQGNLEKGIVGYRIGVADRANNKSIIHKGMVFNMREETLPDCTTSYFPNYPFNDLREDPYLGTTELVNAGNLLPWKYRGNFTPMSAYSKDKFQYVSPDIQYQQSDTNFTELITYREENGYIASSFNQTEEVPKVVIMSDAMYQILSGLIKVGTVLTILPGIDAPFSPFEVAVEIPDTFHRLLAGKNYAYNVLVDSKFTKSNTTNIVPGKRRRQVKNSGYMQPLRQNIAGFKINNYERESGLFLNLNNQLDNPSVQDTSRFTYAQIKNKEYQDSTQSNHRTSSYYVGLKRLAASQYGNVNDGIMRPISNLLTDTTTGPLIGGDNYITKHTYIRKFPFFTKLPINTPFDTPYVLSDSLNVGFPKYWMDVVDRNELLNVITKSTFGRVISSLVGVSDKNYYLEFGAIPVKTSCNGKAKSNFTFALVNGMYYTHIVGVTNFYCESEYIAPYREINEVPQSNYLRSEKDIIEYNTVIYPEMFLYNLQHKYHGIPSKFSTHDYTKDCCTKDNSANYRLIFSTTDFTNFRPNNYQQFSTDNGAFTSITAFNNYNFLFTFENGAYVTQSDEGILTTNGTVYLGVGSIFQRRLRKVSFEHNGLGGCIDKDSIVNTPFGLYYFDRNRKTVIEFTDTLKEVDHNLKSYFINGLNSEITGVYDNFSKNIYWSSKDMTLSFKTTRKSFISFFDWGFSHALRGNMNFYTVNRDKGATSAIWSHNQENHYQEYYGKSYPFEVGYIMNNNYKQTKLEEISVFSEFYENKGWSQKKFVNKFFNKGLIFNDYNSSAIQQLNLREVKQDSLSDSLPGTGVNVSRLDYNLFRFNGFKNMLRTTNSIKFTGHNYEVINTQEYSIDNENKPIRGKYFKLHLISDGDNPEIKKLVQLSLGNINEQV